MIKSKIFTHFFLNFDFFGSSFQAKASFYRLKVLMLKSQIFLSLFSCFTWLLKFSCLIATFNWHIISCFLTFILNYINTLLNFITIIWYLTRQLFFGAACWVNHQKVIFLIMKVFKVINIFSPWNVMWWPKLHYLLSQ